MHYMTHNVCTSKSNTQGIINQHFTDISIPSNLECRETIAIHDVFTIFLFVNLKGNNL